MTESYRFLLGGQELSLLQHLHQQSKEHLSQAIRKLSALKLVIGISLGKNAASFTKFLTRKY